MVPMEVIAFRKVGVSSKVEKRLRNIAMSTSDCIMERSIGAQVAMVDLSFSIEK